jgi:hypothetical protein
MGYFLNICVNELQTLPTLWFMGQTKHSLNMKKLMPIATSSIVV